MILGVSDASSILFVIVPPVPGKAGNIFPFPTILSHFS